MNNSAKKILSALCALILLLTSFSFFAFADEAPTHTDEDVVKVSMYGIIETTNDLIGLKVGEERKLEYTVGDIQLNVTYKDGVSETLTYTPSLPEKAKVSFYTSEYYEQRYKELYSQAVVDGKVIDEDAYWKAEWFLVNYGFLKCDALEITEDGAFRAVKSDYQELYYSVEYAEEDYQAVRDKYANAEVTVDECPQTSLTVDVYGKVYRIYNPNSGEHLYTKNLEEIFILVREGWKYEGIAWYVPVKGASVIRLYNPNAGDHHYTTDISEINYLCKLGWKFEGEAFCSAENGGNAIYRRYNPNAVAGAHLFTTSLEEADYVVSLGWRNEAVAFYGY